MSIAHAAEEGQGRLDPVVHAAIRADEGGPALIAHRGASALRPEHTLEAYARAVEDGADFIEPDLVMTRDGVLVSRHENGLGDTTDVADHPRFADRRTTRQVDGVEVEGWFSEDFTLEELRGLRAVERLPDLRGSLFDGRYPVPTLDEIIEFTAQLSEHHGRLIGLVPEIKHSTHFHAAGLDPEAALMEVLARHEYVRRVPFGVQSFEVGNLKRLRTLLDEAGLRNVFLVQLLGTPDASPQDLVEAGKPLPYLHMLTPEGLAAIAAYADVVAPHLRYVLPVTGEGALAGPTPLVPAAHAAGLAVHAWTLRPENHFLPPALRCEGGPETRCLPGREQSGNRRAVRVEHAARKVGLHSAQALAADHELADRDQRTGPCVVDPLETAGAQSVCTPVAQVRDATQLLVIVQRAARHLRRGPPGCLPARAAGAFGGARGPGTLGGLALGGACGGGAQLLDHVLQRAGVAAQALFALAPVGIFGFQPSQPPGALAALVLQLGKLGGLALALGLQRCGAFADLPLHRLQLLQFARQGADAPGALVLQVAVVGEHAVGVADPVLGQQQLERGGVADGVGRAQQRGQLPALAAQALVQLDASRAQFGQGDFLLLDPLPGLAQGAGGRGHPLVGLAQRARGLAALAFQLAPIGGHRLQLLLDPGQALLGLALLVLGRRGRGRQRQRGGQHQQRAARTRHRHQPGCSRLRPVISSGTGTPAMSSRVGAKSRSEPPSRSPASRAPT